MKNSLTIIQIISSVILIGLILLQQKGGGLGASFGSETFVFSTRRGLEKIIFYLTIIFITAIIILSLLRLTLA